VTPQQLLFGKVPVYLGSGAMHYYQGYPTQADIPSAPATADATAITIFKMISHVLLFFASIH
jgi:hypothetical protein